MRNWFYFIYTAVLALACWANAAVASAQAPGEQTAVSSGKSYVVSYMVVVLAIALGLLVVCRSGGRSNEPKLEDLD